jgi:hypothetical protein
MTKKRVIVRHKKFPFPVNVECNVKVQGQRTMLKHVRLVPFPEGNEMVKVLTGHRGRPMHLPVEQIERVRPL